MLTVCAGMFANEISETFFPADGKHAAKKLVPCKPLLLLSGRACNLLQVRRRRSCCRPSQCSGLALWSGRSVGCSLATWATPLAVRTTTHYPHPAGHSQHRLSLLLEPLICSVRAGVYAMRLSLILMAVPTLVMAGLPGYSTLGVLSPVLLLLTRLLQVRLPQALLAARSAHSSSRPDLPSLPTSSSSSVALVTGSG